PSVLSQLWLVDNRIIERSEFAEGSIFTDMITQVNAAPFSIFASPDQLQFAPLVERRAQQAILTERLARLVRALPHTPYIAVGLNLTWHMVVEERVDVGRISRRLFYNPGSALFQEFDDDGARFGGYLSKDSHGFRMKLDVKPMLVQTTDAQTELLQFA